MRTNASSLRFMRRAIELSRLHMELGHGGPFGAVIVKDGEILGEGWNQVTSSHDPTAHAEVVAIRQACARLGVFQLRGCEIYTSCEPCPMCLAAIYWARLDRIWYANDRADAAAIQFDDDWLYREVGLPMEERSLPTFQVLRDEAQAVFQSWDRKADKIPY
ncbi:nucleoside deaminase [Geothrix campi]|uniref:nucleoside deaminase n=1 Tax=Geothrix campi TaxID=2966450 RepID=UPI002148B7EB|nr:nucleoside deaminase [Geothrix sp. SG10]